MSVSDKSSSRDHSGSESGAGVVDLEPPFDLTRLLIEGISETCTDEMIQLYVLLVLNFNLDDTFKIEEIRRNKKRVMIKFNRQLAFDEIATRQKKVPELCGKLITFHKVRVPNTIRVSELANTCTKEVLNLYFSNPKISNGGDLRSIKLYSYENKSLIQFRNYTKVNDVMSRTHIICERSVKLEKYYGPIEDEYFKEEEEAEAELNQKRSGLEQQSSVDAKGNKAIVLPAAPSDKSKQINAIDKTKLIISNIPENVTIQQLEFLVQLVTNKSDIYEINWSLDIKGKLLIDFNREMDINRILKEFSNNTLNNVNGKPIILEAVNVTKTLVVLVKDYRQSRPKASLRDEDEYKPEYIPATRDLLDLYFANKQRSGGGEVETIERKSSRHWLVVMKDQRSVKEILSKKHVVDEKNIKVFPYFENFGLPYVFKPLFDDMASNRAPAFKLKIKEERLRYFCGQRTLHLKLNEILSESNAMAKFNREETSMLYVNYFEKLQTKVPYTERIWRLRVKESIEYFLQIYKYEKLTLSFNQWSIIQKTKSLHDVIVKFSRRKNNNDGGLYGAGDDDDMNFDADSFGVEAKKPAPAAEPSAEAPIINVNETSTNVELSIIGFNLEVDRFIVKIKDTICKAYFTFELEEKIIKFKTYLFECEELLAKWLNDSLDGVTDSDAESVVSNMSSTLKLNKSKLQTIEEFISKLERDHLDMELSYGKLFQELGYAFLNQPAKDDADTEFQDNDSLDEYREFNDRLTTTLDELSAKSKENELESQMDKIKNTLDNLRDRINDMRKKFRQYTINSKRQKRQVNQRSYQNVDEEDDQAEADGGQEDEDEFFKLCVYIKEASRIITIRVHRKCKLRELKQSIYDRLMADSDLNRRGNILVSDMILLFNNSELASENLTLNDYGVNDKCTITLEFAD